MLAAIILSWVVPPFVSRGLSRFQVAIPAVVNATAFSIYFGRLGYGYVQGSSSILGYSVTHYVLVPALIAGGGALLHIIVRPRIPISSGNADSDRI